MSALGLECRGSVISTCREISSLSTTVFRGLRFWCDFSTNNKTPCPYKFHHDGDETLVSAGETARARSKVSRKLVSRKLVSTRDKVKPPEAFRKRLAFYPLVISIPASLSWVCVVCLPSFQKYPGLEFAQRWWMRLDPAGRNMLARLQNMAAETKERTSRHANKGCCLQ